MYLRRNPWTGQILCGISIPSYCPIMLHGIQKNHSRNFSEERLRRRYGFSVEMPLKNRRNPLTLLK